MLATGFSYLLVFLLGKTLVKTKSLGLLIGGIAGALVFHLVTCSFAWWSNPAYAKTFNGLIQANTVGQPGFPPAYLFLKNTVASSILFQNHHRMGGLANARTGSVYSVRSKDRRSELTRG